MIHLVILMMVILNSIDGREDFRIHSVNMTDGSHKLSIIGRQGLQGEYVFKLVPDFVEKNYVSRAHFLEQVNSTGWSHLMVESSMEYSDELQAYFSGVLESVITRPLIAAHWHNAYDGHCKSLTSNCTKLVDYLKQNFLSIVYRTRNQSGFLKMVRLNLWQAKGIQDGFDGNWKRNSSEINENYLLEMKDQLLLLNILQLNGDLFDIPNILPDSNYQPRFRRQDALDNDRCSALIKYVKGSIYSSHVAWYDYRWMLRMTKFYDFPYRINANEKSSAIVPGRKLSFSSYPGLISSMDDFYKTSSGLVVIETTIGNPNLALYKPLKNMASEIVFEYSRVLAANRLALTGEEWSKLFATRNSGTYNNQWMVVNYNLMKNHSYGERIPDGVLYVAEQIPTLVVYEDVTEYLRTQTFWPSYNLPFNKTIWDLGDFQSRVSGNFSDYNNCPRARIFKRDAPKVNDEVSLMKFMRYNNFEHDPLSWCNSKPPYNAAFGVSARYDLNEPNVSYSCASGFGLFGAYDMKYTTSKWMSEMTFVGISGPTFDQQPVFDWTKIDDHKTHHQMQPERFQFPPVQTPFP